MPWRGQFTLSLWSNGSDDLDAFIARRPADCSLVSREQYGRAVATCSVGGIDLGADPQWTAAGLAAVFKGQLSRSPA